MDYFAKYFEIQIANVPKIRVKEIKCDPISEVNINNSSIMRFNSLKHFKNEHSHVFKNLKKNPIPTYSEEMVAYDDYVLYAKEQEKGKVIKDDNIDIFNRDRDNFVKNDILLDIMKKINKKS